VARDESGVGSFLGEDPGAVVVPSLDLTRKVSRLELDARPARRLGPEGDQSAIWKRVVDDTVVAVCAELVGTCEAAVDLAVEYAKNRVQFDRPIATFQVIKHKAVDMLHKRELARVGTHYAAWASDTDDLQREAAAAMCKGFVGEAADFITAEDIQIHGGMGFTWEVDAHVHYRRAKQDDVLFGSGAHHRKRLADLVLGPA
jgi:alkylation response protein AidB-like acyl-CoA dehydrogenase